MTAKYVQVVFEAKEEFIRGYLQGFMAGKGATWRYFFNHNAGIKAESLKEKIREWTSLSDKYQYLILPQELYDGVKQSGLQVLSSQPVAAGKFSVTVKCACAKETQEIKKIIAEKPADLQTLDWQEDEKTDKKAHGVELYTPAHEYTCEASGSFAGEIETVIEFRRKLAEHSVVDARQIELEFAE